MMKNSITTTEILDIVIASTKGVVNDDTRMYVNLRNAAEILGIKCFDSIVKIYAENTSRGLSYNLSGNKILVYNVAGRIMVTLSNKNCSVTIVGADDINHHAGLHAANGDVIEIFDLLEFFLQNWYKVKLKVNKSVEII